MFFIIYTVVSTQYFLNIFLLKQTNKNPISTIKWVIFTIYVESEAKQLTVFVGIII